MEATTVTLVTVAAAAAAAAARVSYGVKFLLAASVATWQEPESDMKELRVNLCDSELDFQA